MTYKNSSQHNLVKIEKGSKCKSEIKDEDAVNKIEAKRSALRSDKVDWYNAKDSYEIYKLVSPKLLEENEHVKKAIKKSSTKTFFRFEKVNIS